MGLFSDCKVRISYLAVLIIIHVVYYYQKFRELSVFFLFFLSIISQKTSTVGLTSIKLFRMYNCEERNETYRETIWNRHFVCRVLQCSFAGVKLITLQFILNNPTLIEIPMGNVHEFIMWAEWWGSLHSWNTGIGFDRLVNDENKWLPLGVFSQH